MREAKTIWAADLGLVDAEGLVNYGERCQGKYGMMIYRDDLESIRHAYHWYSYLAKENTKEGVPGGVRRWGSSRVPEQFAVNQTK